MEQKRLNKAVNVELIENKYDQCLASGCLELLVKIDETVRSVRDSVTIGTVTLVLVLLLGIDHVLQKILYAISHWSGETRFQLGFRKCVHTVQCRRQGHDRQCRLTAAHQRKQRRRSSYDWVLHWFVGQGGCCLLLGSIILRHRKLIIRCEPAR